jgi:hypothetical protein
MKVTQEALTGVRVMKMYSWEHSFLKAIADLRLKELGFVKILLVIRASISAFTTVQCPFESLGANVFFFKSLIPPRCFLQ